YLLIQQSVSLGWRGIQVASAEAVALRLAQDRLASAGIEAPLQNGQQTSGSEGGYDWSIQIQPYAQTDSDRKPTQLAAYWVTVEVHWREGPLRRNRSLQLSTLKLKAPR